MLIRFKIQKVHADRGRTHRRHRGYADGMKLAARERGGMETVSLTSCPPAGENPCIVEKKLLQTTRFFSSCRTTSWTLPSAADEMRARRVRAKPEKAVSAHSDGFAQRRNRWICAAHSVCRSRVDTCAATPKSASLTTPSEERSRLAHLMSLWIMPRFWPCKYSRPLSASWHAAAIASCGERGSVEATWGG
eukprot:424668-Pleurochrysis_carterae.AAC.1